MAMLSSPLAAMQPAQHPPAFGLGMDPESSSRQSGSIGRSTKFSFPDLIAPTKRDRSTDRGSSPTVSLVADMSQNFYIEKRLVTHAVWVHC
jgi:hypothetical protein